MIYTIRYFFDGDKNFTEAEFNANSGTEALNLARDLAKMARASHFNVSLGEINRNV